MASSSEEPAPTVTPPRPKKRRWLRIVLLSVLVASLVGGLVLYGSTSWGKALGASASGERLARMQKSERFAEGVFTNAEETSTMRSGRAFDSTMAWLTGDEMRSPPCQLPRAETPAVLDVLATSPASGLRLTWLGHSTVLIEIDGKRILTDPVFSERSSPSTIVGPKRFHPVPVAIDALPALDAVILSHDHYDHLDMQSIVALSARDVRFYVPLGVGAHIERWGVAPDRVIEHDWWERSVVGDLTLVATPARHFSGRSLGDGNKTLWASWSLLGPKHRVYFSGDTGMTDAFDRIGKELGPFDVAMLEVGAWHESWGDIHLGPQGALDAFAMLDAKVLFPVHWGTFNLGIHAWSEPAEELVTEAEKRAVPVLTPVVGTPVEPTETQASTPWWRDLPPMTPDCP